MPSSIIDIVLPRHSFSTEGSFVRETICTKEPFTRRAPQAFQGRQVPQDDATLLS